MSPIVRARICGYMDVEHDCCCPTCGDGDSLASGWQAAEVCTVRGGSWRAVAPAAATVRRMTAAVDVSYLWHEAPVPGGLEIAKVYGFLVCPGTARILVQEDNGSFNLPGGSPEPVDADFSATLAREAMEESQVVVAGTAYLGYQEVRRPGVAPYAQVRMAGLIGGFGPRRPDPDGGRLLRRWMCPPADVPQVLGWGQVVQAQVVLAARTAETLWRVPVGVLEPAGYVD